MQIPSALNDPDKADSDFTTNCNKKFITPKEWDIKGKKVPNAFIEHKRTRRSYQGEGFKIIHYANQVLYDTAGELSAAMLCASTMWLQDGSKRTWTECLLCVTSALPDQGI